MGNIYKGIARQINCEEVKKREYPTIDEGVRGMEFIETAVRSNKEGNIWLELNS